MSNKNSFEHRVSLLKGNTRAQLKILKEKLKQDLKATRKKKTFDNIDAFYSNQKEGKAHKYLLEKKKNHLI